MSIEVWWKRGLQSAFSKRAERKLLSKWMQWPTKGVCCAWFFIRKEFIWLQAEVGWTAFRVCCFKSILFTFRASEDEL